MTNDNRKTKTTKRKSNSFIWRGLNAITSSIYSFFANSRVIRKMSVDDQTYEKSVIAGVFGKKSNAERDRSRRYLGLLFEKSRALNLLSRLGTVFASMAINVYGTFFVVYSLASIFMYYIAMMLNGKYDNGSSAIITPIVILVCSIPMLFSSTSVSNAVLGSRSMRKIVLSLFSIPEEKLRSNTTIVGSEYMFMSAIVALLLGILTYFLHPAYVPVIFGLIIVICLIFSNPETGVLMTVAVAPFLQYTKYDKEILCAMIVVSMISYISKIIRRRRTTFLSSESILVFLLCGFMFAASIFSAGGVETFKESIYAVILIVGGFFLTYNLIRGKDRLAVCSKILLVSFFVICLSGIWNVFYNAIVEHNIYSIRENVSLLFENNVIYIADSATVFSVLSVLLMPLLISNIVRATNFKRRSFAIIMAMMATITVFIYGSYEAVIAILIEFLVFGLLYSHKSLSALVIALIPISLIFVVYSYLMQIWDLPDAVQILRNVLPLNDSGSAYRASVVEGVSAMIKNGNWSGIGVGEHALKASFYMYSTPVTEGLSTAGNFWLQLICWSGIGGLICFSVMAFLLISKGIGYSLTLKKSSMKENLTALLCGFSISLLFGGVNCIWVDSRMIYLFWVCVGLLAGYVRECKNDDKRRNSEFSDSYSSKDIELRS